MENGEEAVLFGDVGQRDSDAMAPIDTKQRIERRMLDLLADSGLPLPDEVQYDATCVRFVWLDRKVAVEVELNDFSEVDAFGGYDREDVAA